MTGIYLLVLVVHVLEDAQEMVEIREECRTTNRTRRTRAWQVPWTPQALIGGDLAAVSKLIVRESLREFSKKLSGMRSTSIEKLIFTIIFQYLYSSQ